MGQAQIDEKPYEKKGDGPIILDFHPHDQTVCSWFSMKINCKERGSSSGKCVLFS
jgi:hypothetical protein